MQKSYAQREDTLLYSPEVISNPSPESKDSNQVIEVGVKMNIIRDTSYINQYLVWLKTLIASCKRKSDWGN